MDKFTVTHTQLLAALPSLGTLWALPMAELRKRNRELERACNDRGLTKAQLVLQIHFNLDAPEDKDLNVENERLELEVSRLSQLLKDKTNMMIMSDFDLGRRNRELHTLKEAIKIITRD